MHKASLIIILAAWPLIVYSGLHFFTVKTIGLVTASLFALRWWLIRKTISATQWRSFYPVIVPGVACGLLGTALDDATYVKLTPCLISVSFLCAFAYTLWRPPSMIERIARLSTPELPDAAISYTAKVTLVWCAFFTLNAVIALYTALYTALEIWTLYNGLLSYVLMGLLFGGEYCVRQQVIKKQVLND